MWKKRKNESAGKDAPPFMPGIRHHHVSLASEPSSIGIILAGD